MSDVELLQEAVVRGVVRDIVEYEDLGLEDAMRQFASSKVFLQVMQPETQLYRESPDYVYEMYCREHAHC